MIVAFITTAFALVGAEGWGGNWRGYVAGGIAGLLFGAIAVGLQGSCVDALFPPGPFEPEGDDG